MRSSRLAALLQVREDRVFGFTKCCPASYANSSS